MSTPNGQRSSTDLHVCGVSGADVPPSVQLRERPEGRGGDFGAHPFHRWAEQVVHVPQEESGEVTTVGKCQKTYVICTDMSKKSKDRLRDPAL